jgi:hypothetical protein
MSEKIKMGKKARIARLDTFMRIFDLLYDLEPDLLEYTDWNSNDDSYNQMINRINNGE